MDLTDNNFYLTDYEDIWFVNCDTRYRALKGGRSTGKSYNFIGLEPIFKILSDSRRNIVFARQNYKDNSTSTYNQIKKCIYSLHLQRFFKFNISPLKIIRIDTGQAMLFGGMNDVDNLLSTTFEVGYWTDLYFEEASQLKSYEDFRRVDGSMRIPNTEPDLKCQVTFLFNAWDDGHWLYDVFFKGNLEDDINTLERVGYQFYRDDNFNLGQDSNGLALHISSYKCNSYNSDQKIANALELKNIAYPIYLVESLGCWGSTTDKVYECWSDSLIVPQHIANTNSYSMWSVGIDTAYSDGQGKPRTEDVGSAMTMILGGMVGNKKLVAINEYYHTNIGAKVRKTSVDYQNDLIDTLFKWKSMYSFLSLGFNVYVDCADIGFRQSLEDMAKKRGLWGVRFYGSTKLPIHNRIVIENHLMAFGEFEISEACPNLIREIKSCRYDEDHRRMDTNDHAINCYEYSIAPIQCKLLRWNTIKLQ